MLFFAVLENVHSELYGVADHALSEANGLPPSERAAKAVLAVCRRLSDTGDMVFIENDAKLLLQRLPKDVKNVHYHDDETHNSSASGKNIVLFLNGGFHLPPRQYAD